MTPSSSSDRRRERLGAAALRAVGAEPGAEYRAGQLAVGDRPLTFSAPWLMNDGNDRYRGLVDAMAVRLRYSDRALHASLEPVDDVIARLVFDLLEQLRCEACVPEELAGVRSNLEASFRAWNEAETITETSLGLLLYTVAHMVRSRLIHPLQNELIEDKIEATRANISPLIGTPLKALRPLVGDQAAYAEPARELALAVGELVEGTAMDGPDSEAGRRLVTQLMIPPDWDGDADVNAEAVEGGGYGPLVRDRAEGLESIGGYHVYSRANDQVVTGAGLYPVHIRRPLRERLDGLIAEQAVSVFTIARRLQRILAGSVVDGWRTGEEDGVLDPARLTQIVANPTQQHVFRQPRFRPTSPAVVSFLIDNSGSMKQQRHESVAVLVDTLARALDLAGASSEILGFTTSSWSGGDTVRQWRRSGQQPNPGRLAELSHIIYKDADTPWKRARSSVAALMRTQHFRESIDGEAIIWAYRRLLARPEPRKILIVVSDGAPTEAATANANGDTFLEAHLFNVVAQIQRSPEVEIAALAIDHPVDTFFATSAPIDLSGTLTLASYRVLEALLLPR